MSTNMSTSMRESFPTGRTFAVNLTGTAQYIAAEKLLESKETLPILGSVLTLPQFAIVDFEGRESINRVQWQGGSCVRVVEDGAREIIQWTIEDSSLPTTTGIVEIVPLVSGGHELVGDLPRLVTGTEPELRSGTSVHAQVRNLTITRDAGKKNMFALVMLLLPYVRQSVESAARRIFREIHDVASSDDTQVIPVIDQVEADVVVDRMLYGDQGNEGSMVTRLLRRAAATDAVVKKSVLQFISLAIWSSAETHVRAAIGDPHAGRVIRRLARMIRSVEPEVVLDAYREAYPDAQMGLGRVKAALTAGATIGAQQIPWESVPSTDEENATWQ